MTITTNDLCAALIEARETISNEGLTASMAIDVALAAPVQPVALPAGMEPAGEVGSMPGTSGFTMACFHADKVPTGTWLYTAVQVQTMLATGGQAQAMAIGASHAEIQELREGLGQIAIEHTKDPVKIKCCRLIDAVLASQIRPATAAVEPVAIEAGHLFEFWWAEYMPEATQDRAWKAWQDAPNARNVGVAAPQPQQIAEPESEPMLRFCPGCGSCGPVPAKFRDCCPDGGDSRVIPASLANKCRDLFRLAVAKATTKEPS